MGHTLNSISGPTQGFGKAWIEILAPPLPGCYSSNFTFFICSTATVLEGEIHCSGYSEFCISDPLIFHLPIQPLPLTVSFLSSYTSAHFLVG